MKRITSPGAVLLAAGLLGVVAPSIARADEPTTTTAPPTDEAKRLFASGIALLQDPEGERVEEAYAQFKRAYELSKLPKILGNIGYCAFRLERDGEAMDAYREYLRLVPDVDPREKAQIERDLAVIGTSTSVTIDAKGAAPGDELILRDTRTPVRGQPVTNTYPAKAASTTLRIRPGHHTIVAVVANAERGRWELDAASDATLRHTFDVTVVETPKAVAATTTVPEAPKPRVGPWIMIGVGAAALAAGVVTTIVTAKKVSSLNDQKLSTGQYPGTSSFRDDRDSAKTLATTSYVLYAAGGVIAAGGLAWLFFGGHSAEKSTTAKLGVLPACGLDGCRASFQGTF